MILGAISGDLDPLGWAKRPKSPWALQAVIATAKSGDERFVAIFSKLVEGGVCMEDGKLLQRWDGQSWSLVRRETRYRDAA